jgi:hypothetical protein
MENLINAGLDVAVDKNGFYWFATSWRIGEEIWARLAHQEYRHNQSVRHSLRSSGGFGPSSDELWRLKVWSKMLKASADWDEGSNSPSVYIQNSDVNTSTQTLVLGWKGTWTKNREVCVEFFPNDEGGIAYVRYNTGTGSPSSFLEKIFISAKAEAEDVIIPAEMARSVRNSLAMAYGGYSQFGTEDVIKAVCGHVRNGTLLRREKSVSMAVIEAALLQEEERWEGTGPPTPTSEEWLLIHKEGDRVVGECWEAQRVGFAVGFAARSAGRPRPPAIVD